MMPFISQAPSVVSKIFQQTLNNRLQQMDAAYQHYLQIEQQQMKVAQEPLGNLFRKPPKPYKKDASGQWWKDGKKVRWCDIRHEVDECYKRVRKRKLARKRRTVWWRWWRRNWEYWL